MILSNILVGIEPEKRLISVSFTALVLNELIMIAIEINTWHKYMVYAEAATFAFYFISIPFLGDYYGTELLSLVNNRLVVYHHVGVYLEDYGNIIS